VNASGKPHWLSQIDSAIDYVDTSIPNGARRLASSGLKSFPKQVVTPVTETFDARGFAAGGIGHGGRIGGKMSIGTVTVIVGLSLLMPVAAWSQTTAPKEATDLGHEEIAAHIKEAIKQEVSDRNIRVVDVGPYSVGAAVILRRHPSATSKGIGRIEGVTTHNDYTEVYYVLRGYGTQLTGGTIIESRAAGGAPTVEGGRESALKAGDVQIVPVGVPHGWKAGSVAPEGIDYLIVRIDPTRKIKQNNLVPAAPLK
jgi:mannose-6-phosphate isomerase-like protein (cupin superfamily)